MLSIGVVTAEGLGYYLDTVASGVDDYYVRSDPGYWTGNGATGLGLSGTVDAEAIHSVAGRYHPRTGAPLGGRAGKVVAYDLTFSSPKSVSVLAGLGAPAVQTAVDAAHREAVGEALALLESDGLRGRRGAAGASQVEVSGAVAAGFTHRTSRAGDPQLHTHLLVLNGALGVDGRWGALHSRRIFGWAKTAGYVYQAALRAGLSERLGVTWTPVRNGTAEVVGIPEAVVAEFSQRRAQIEAHLAEVGQTSARAAQAATLTTRPTKPEPLDPAVQQAAWWDRAATAGLDHQLLDQAAPWTPTSIRHLNRGSAILTPDDLDRLADRLAGATGLTEHRSTFDRRHLVEAVAAHAGAGAHLHDLDEAVAWIVEDHQIVPTGADHPLAGQAFTTADLLAAEATVVDLAARVPDRPVRTCPPETLDTVLSARPPLSTEQRAMVETVTSTALPVTVVVGRAGTGKTFALEAARAAWSASGIPVVGAALAARTAQALEAGTGIPSATVDQILTDLARPGQPLGSVLPIGGFLVLDEAGMVGTRKLAGLLGAAQRHNTRAVLVGDPRQLPEVDAGGAFAHLASRPGTVELTENRRQHQPWERDALAQVRHGDIERAVTVYRDRQRITLAASAEEARETLVADWWTAHRAAGGTTLMMALTQADVDDLNARARAHLAAAGLLGPETLEAAGKAYAAGDQVLFLRNDRRLGVSNGQRATVTALTETGGLVVRSDTSERPPLTVPASYLDAGHVTHGYASTIHKAQGITVDQAFLLGSERLYREAGYTALSRARTRTGLYHVHPTPARWEPTVDPYQKLAGQLERTRQQQLATPLPTGPGPAGPSENPPHHLPAVLAAAALADPPGYLVARLGPPPLTGPARATWGRAAGAVETYRDRHGITGPDPLGPAPADPASAQARLRRLADVSLRQAEHALARTPDRGLGLGR